MKIYSESGRPIVLVGKVCHSQVIGLAHNSKGSILISRRSVSRVWTLEDEGSSRDSPDIALFWFILNNCRGPRDETRFGISMILSFAPDSLPALAIRDVCDCSAQPRWSSHFPKEFATVPFYL